MVSRNLKVCLSVSAIVLIVVSTINVALFLTVFKVRDPNIILSISRFDLPTTPGISRNISIPVLIIIKNSNYGNFKYIDSFSYITYQDALVGTVPIPSQLVPARGGINVTTHANIMYDELINNPKFVVNGTNFSLMSKAELPGKVIIHSFIKIKMKAMATNQCDISVNITSHDVVSNCISHIKIYL
ncbi:uncharacterized protein LOC131629087 [Vicia villosa]|uniref:uncharacterized protein LOC131629087 n=1 Tax=Vicia villosa TaxID=3911 RepID=UPI00273CB8AC|nr:uncharacterized protein LOC131629087 [Vicia villosa]